MRVRRLAVTSAVVGLTLGVAAVLAPDASAIRVDRVVHAAKVTAHTRMPRKNSKNWKIVYATQFTGKLNTRTAWSVYTRPGSSNPGTAWFSAKHVTVSHGQLHIKGYVDRAVKADGRVVTGGLGLWKRPERYGRYTMLVRMDACADVKYAWLLWPYDNKWPSGGEIDFAEDEGGNRRLTTASVNYAGAGGRVATLPQDYAAPKRPFSGWHVIGVDWTPHSIAYRIDGQYWGSVKHTHIPRTPMVFVLQTEGKARPGHVTLHGQCNADIGWVVQYKYRGPR